eukprot:478350_1
MESAFINIELTNANNNEKESKPTQNDIIFQSLRIDDFMEPREDDYIDCHKNLPQCPAANRVAYLLRYYKNTQKYPSDSDSQKRQIWEQLSISHPSYQISNIMDDWHHVKTVHLLNTENVEYFENNKQINCKDGYDCLQFIRYQRD